MERVHVTSLFTEAELQDALDRGMVTKRKHPSLDLWIYNYSAATQFAWEWTPVTLNCRGLVLDENLNIIARSLPKFFSYEQLEGKLPEGDFVVEEKMDGSMLIVFKYKNEIVTATRGSFESDQALKGKKLLPSNFDINEGFTWVFEVIYPENRVVVTYDYEGLVLLAIVETSGIEQPNVDAYVELYGFKSPKRYSFTSLEEILNYKEDNLEGFVLRYINDNYDRVKIKLEDYKRLHRLLTGFNEKDVWEALKEDKLASVLEEVPDEMYDWIKSVEKDLTSKFNEIRLDAMMHMKDLGDRKANAEYYKTQKYPSLMFNLLDGKDITEAVWKMCRPKVTQTFKLVGEDNN